MDSFQNFSCWTGLPNTNIPSHVVYICRVSDQLLISLINIRLSIFSLDVAYAIIRVFLLSWSRVLELHGIRVVSTMLSQTCYGRICPNVLLSISIWDNLCTRFSSFLQIICCVNCALLTREGVPLFCFHRMSLGSLSLCLPCLYRWVSDVLF